MNEDEMRHEFWEREGRMPSDFEESMFPQDHWSRFGYHMED
jgi:hypothetical protein